MAKQSVTPATAWAANSTNPFADQSYQDGDRTNSAPNSGAILSGGTIIRGLYDYASGVAPTDSTYFQGANGAGSLVYTDNYAKGIWPNGGGTPYTDMGILAGDYQEIYVEFEARYPGTVHGNKFCKLFGSSAGTGYANMTAGPNYSANQSFDRISFGDGTTVSQDTTHQIRLDGTTDANDMGRGWATSNINTPNGEFIATDWGTDWHTFRMYFKYNTGTTSGNEVANAAAYLDIDGVLYCDAGGFFNRNPNNSQYASAIGLFGYLQGNSVDIELNYDNVKLTVGGFE